MTTARATQTIDDDRLRVTTWTFAPGEQTGPHRHEFDYLVVPVTGGTFEVLDADGASRGMTQRAGVPYPGREGTAHNVINRGPQEATFVEIELKSGAGSGPRGGTL
jgi:predicted metal-dependent enzyme (double-stranded beta helix superfamily)